MTFKKSIVYLLSLALLQGSIAFAKPDEEKTVSLRKFAEGERTYSSEDAHQTLDEKTIFDLELRSVLIPYLAGMALTPLGAMRIQWLLTHPSTDARAIQARQAAVQEIASNDEVFNGLKTSFESLGNIFKQYGLPVVFDPNRSIPLRSLFHQELAKGTFGNLINPIEYMRGGLLTAATVYELFLLAQGDWISASSILMFNLFFSGAAGSNVMLAQMKGALDAAEVVRNGLRNTQSDLLRELLGQCDKGSKCVTGSRRNASLLPIKTWSKVILDMFGPGMLIRATTRSAMKKELNSIVQMMGLLGELESLYAAAAFYRSHKEALTFPEVADSDRPYMMARQIHHPYLLFGQKGSIANNVNFDGTETGIKTAIITGPNAGGKTTYLRNLALARIQSAAGFPIAADPGMRISTYRIFTNFTNVGDSSEEGASTFRAQAKRVGGMFDVLEDPGPILLLMDEILTGTSNEEHRAAERAVLEDIHNMPNALVALATHDRSLTTLANEVPQVLNLHVDEKGYIIYDGPAEKYNAFDVMAESKVPERIIKRSREIFACEMALKEKAKGSASAPQ